MEAPNGKLTSSANSKVVKNTVASLKKAPHVTKAVSPLSSQGSAYLSKDEKIGYIPVTIGLSQSDLTEEQAQTIIDHESPAVDANFQVANGGYLGNAVSKPDVESSELVGIIAAIIILIFMFGTLTAMSLPILTALVGVGTGLALIGLLGHGIAVPTVGPTLGTMLGLGVGIDYALFIVSRHKGFMEQGFDTDEAAARSVATAGGAVVFAGGTVVIALVSLAVAQIPTRQRPGLFGRGRGPDRDPHRDHADPRPAGDHGQAHRLPAGSLPEAAPARSPPPWLGSLGSLHREPSDPGDADRGRGSSSCWPSRCSTCSWASRTTAQMPKSTTVRQAYDLIDKGFGPGTNGPLLIAVDFGKDKAHNDQKKLNQLKSQQQQQEQQAVQQATQQLEAQGVPPDQAHLRGRAAGLLAAADQEGEAGGPAGAVPEDDGERSASGPPPEPDRQDEGRQGRIAVGRRQLRQRRGLQRHPHHGAVRGRHDDLVNHLRDSVIPKADKGTTLTTYVGGQTAAYIDLAARISEKLPLVIAIVIALSIILLLIAFRSIVVPLISALMNLLSVAAAYGVLTFVFQEGHGASLIGVDGGATPIVSYVPLMMFAILFGLSMDYQVFLISRMRGALSSRRATTTRRWSTGWR